MAALTMAGVDVVWLGFVAKGLFQKEIGHLLAKDINFVAAGLFYVFYVTTILVRAASNHETGIVRQILSSSQPQLLLQRKTPQSFFKFHWRGKRSAD